LESAQIFMYLDYRLLIVFFQAEELGNT